MADRFLDRLRGYAAGEELRTPSTSPAATSTGARPGHREASIRTEAAGAEGPRAPGQVTATVASTHFSSRRLVIRHPRSVRANSS